jgi:flagellar hook-associated protein 3 FlgL
MRISTAQFYETSATNYQRTYNNVITTGNEVSSEVKLNTAGDDPVGAARVLQLSQQSSMLNQYKTNISTVNSNMTQAETALSSINDALQTARELVIRASNGTFTDADRKANASELTQLQAQIVGVMNSQDANGQYLFSGAKSTTAPYSLNSDGSYSYQGDQTSINLPIGDGLSVAGNTTGWDAFEQAINTTRTSSTLTSPAVNDGKVSLSGGVVVSSSTYNDKFVAGQPYSVAFLSSSQLKITDAAGNDVTAEASQAGAFSSADASNQPISFRGVNLNLNINLTDAERTSTATADTALAGHSFQLAATPSSISTSRSPGNPSAATITDASVGSTAADMTAYNNSFPAGGAILKFSSATDYDLYASPYTSSSTPVSSGSLSGSTANASGVNFTVSGTPAAGDQFVVQTNTHQTQNILNTLTSVITALNTPADGNPVAMQKLNSSLDSALGNLTSGTEQISSAISSGGARQNAATNQGVTNDSLQASNSTNQSAITASDPVDAIARLTMQKTMLQAMQLVFTQVSQLNLFSKI